MGAFVPLQLYAMRPWLRCSGLLRSSEPFPVRLSSAELTGLPKHLCMAHPLHAKVLLPGQAGSGSMCAEGLSLAGRRWCWPYCEQEFPLGAGLSAGLSIHAEVPLLSHAEVTSWVLGPAELPSRARSSHPFFQGTLAGLYAPHGRCAERNSGLGVVLWVKKPLRGRAKLMTKGVSGGHRWRGSGRSVLVGVGPTRAVARSLQEAVTLLGRRPAVGEEVGQASLPATAGSRLEMKQARGLV